MKPIFVNKNDVSKNANISNDIIQILNYIIYPDYRYGENLYDEGYDYFYQSIHKLQNQDIISVCMGELYE